MKLTKILVGSVVALSMTLPFVASAATISNPLFSNGDTTIDAQGGSTVSGTFALTVGQNEVCEIVRTQADPTQAPLDNSVGGSLGDQQGYYPSVAFSVKVPPNTSTVYPTVQCAGIWGGSHSVDGNDSVVAGPVTLGTLRVTATGSNNVAPGTVPPGWNASDWAAFQQWKNGQSSAPTPAVNPKCTLIAPFLGATPFAYSAMGIQLQSALLLDNPYSIPLLAAGSKVTQGYFGTQTHAALANYNNAYSCH